MPTAKKRSKKLGKKKQVKGIGLKANKKLDLILKRLHNISVRLPHKKHKAYKFKESDFESDFAPSPAQD